jgi:hypothetical protein
MPTQKALEHIVTGSENVPHIVKHSEAEPPSEIRKAYRREAQFLTINEQGGAANRKAGIRIAGTRLI